MKILVCVKQVPDTSEVKMDPETNTLVRQGIPSIVNPFDKYALEAALQLKDKHGGQVTVLSMGPAQAKDALKECLAMGADDAILVSDRAFGGADTLATSYTLAAAVRKTGPYDLIFCGKQAIDGDTAQVGPELAEHLDFAQVTYVAGLAWRDGLILAQREREDGYETIETKLPALFSIVKTAVFAPRLASVKGRLKANKADIPVLGAADLDIEAQRIGLKGSPTQVRRIFTPPQRTQGVLIKKDTAREAAQELWEHLSKANLM